MIRFESRPNGLALLEDEMSDDYHVDGNALGGVLAEIFGREMCGQPACCGNCGAVNFLGAVHVYRGGPGDVLRCPACSSVLMVITSIELTVRVGFEALLWLEPITS